MGLVREMVAQAMKLRGLTQLEVGRRLGHQRNSLVGQVLHDQKTVPLGALDEWAKALEMDEAEKRTFIRAALMELGPPYMQELLREQDELRQELQRVREQIDRYDVDEPSDAP